MATSSIFASFNINDAETAEKFVRALELSEEKERQNPLIPSTSTITDPAAIRALLKKRKEHSGGDAISPETICRIVSVVRGHGFTIETEKCPRCGQSAYISRVSRDDLELVENPMMDDLVSGGEKSVEHLQNLCDKLDQIIHENDGCNCCNGDEALF